MNEPKSSRYQRLRRRTRIVEVAAGAVLLAVVACTPVAQWLAVRTLGWSAWLPEPARFAFAIVCLVLVLTLAWEGLALPLLRYPRVLVERRFRQNGERDGAIAKARARAIAIRLPLVAAAALVVASAAVVAGEWWWLAAGACGALLWIAALHVAPVALARLAGTRAVDRPSLMSALREIAGRAGIRVEDIVVWRADGARAGAFVTGSGRSCRVFVSSDVLRDWSDDEVAVLVAHEIAHHVHGDLWRGLALDAALLSVAFWIADLALDAVGPSIGLAGPSDLAALPFLALSAGSAWAIATPVRLAQSRAHERRADRYALGLTREAGAFGAAVRRLSARHLVEHEPPALARWFFHSHPPVAERLAMAERFAKGEGAASMEPRLPRA